MSFSISPNGLCILKTGCTIICLITLFSLNAQAQQERDWQPDVLGEGFEQITLQMPPDYEGEVVTTLVRSLPDTAVANNKAVLYVHGYNDYFFQEEMAERFTDKGYNFYAVDLRKYGRSLMEHQRMANVRDLTEYFADIDTSLAIIQQAGYEWTLLAGHSTGGLTTSLYAHEHPNSDLFDALFLNSPFFEFDEGFFMRWIAIPFVAWRAQATPDAVVGGGDQSFYGKSLHASEKGEWDFNADWKTLDTQPLTFSWIRAIYVGHQTVHGGLTIDKPVLVMHSDRSLDEDEWSDVYFQGDAVLNVDHIREYAREIQSPDLRIEEIEGGMHDLVLSREPVREEVYRRWFEWLRDITP